MNVTFRCPHCHEPARAEVEPSARRLECPACHTAWDVPDSALADGKLWHCLICPSRELFIRKDFSQAAGVGIVVVGFIVSSIFWAYRMPLWTYGVLFLTALIDVVLYLKVGNLLQCYHCQAQYRQVPGLENHGGFDLETHEKHRQQKIRLAQHATAHAPQHEGVTPRA
jgi:hypothetical protein